MIRLALHNATHIALESDYRHKDEIKALAPYPDVQWDSAAHRWLMHVGMLPKLYEYLGDSIAPASPDFWMECPLYMPGAARKRRRSKREIVVQRKQEQQAAATVGGAIVDNKEVMKW